jgi:hypothetical protein
MSQPLGEVLPPVRLAQLGIAAAIDPTREPARAAVLAELREP